MFREGIRNQVPGKVLEVYWLRLLWTAKGVVFCLLSAFIGEATLRLWTAVRACSVSERIFTWLTFVVVDSKHLWKIGYALQTGSRKWWCHLCQLASVMSDKPNAPNSRAALTGIVRPICTGAALFRCSFVTLLVCPTILTAIKIMCAEFKLK